MGSKPAWVVRAWKERGRQVGTGAGSRSPLGRPGLTGPRRTWSPVWEFGRLRGKPESSRATHSRWLRGVLPSASLALTVLSSLVQGLGCGDRIWGLRVRTTETSSTLPPACPTGSRSISPLGPESPVSDEDVDTLVAQLMDELIAGCR